MNVSRPSESAPKILTNFEANIVSTLGQVMYPREGGIPVDAEQARALEYVERWLAALPLQERVLLRMLFLLIEFSMPVFGPSRARRFTQATPEAQYEYLKTWETSRIYFRRVSMYGLRSVFALAYFADDSVRERIGFESGTTVLERHRRERRHPVLAAVADAPGRDTQANADVVALETALDAVRAHDRAQRAGANTSS